MYALYSREHAILERVRSALPPAERGIATTSWREFVTVAPGADCLLVASRWLSSDLPVLPGVAALSDLPIPVILITTKDADNARCALNTGATHIVWLCDLHRELPSLFRGMRPRHVLSRAALLLEGASRLSPALRRALVYACRADRPMRSVAELAMLLRRDRRTLWRYWQQANGLTLSLRLEDFLDWVLLVHAAHLKSPRRSWTDVAHGLGTHEHTLARMVRRLAGTTLATLSQSTREELDARFLAAAVHPLVIGHDKMGPRETFWACSSTPERSI